MVHGNRLRYPPDHKEGLLTGVFRIFGNSAEGVSYAIIFTNLLVPLIERVTVPVGFGRGGKKKA